MIEPLSVTLPDTDATPQTIATQLGISHATVLLALRDDDRVAPDLRSEVQRLAQDLGIPADRTPAKMGQRRAVRPKPASATIAAITTHVEVCEPYHVGLLRIGAQRAAEALGYRFEVFRARVGARRNAILETMLHRAGVAGVLLLPMARAVRANNYLDWKDFSVVAATDAISLPQFHRVEPDHFDNVVNVCERLVSSGHRRLGYVADGSGDLAAARRFAAAVGWVNAAAGAQPVHLSLYPSLDGAGLCHWFDRQRPDAIVTEADLDAEKIMEALGAGRSKRVTFALNHHAGTSRWSGVDHRYSAIGAAAISQLHARIHAGEKGIPDVPTLTTLKGEWVNAIVSDAATEGALVN